MSSHHAVRRVLRRWPSILVLAAVGVGLGAFWSGSITPRYTAHADVLVAPPGERGTSAPDERVLESYAHVLGGRTTAAGVIDELGLSDSVSSVERSISGRVLDGSTVLRVSGEARTASAAADVSQAAATSFVDWFREQETGLQAAVVEPAATPSSPSSPSTPRWLLVGGLLGLLAGLALAAGRNARDRGIRSPAELQEISGAPVLGAVAYDRAAVQNPLITSLGTHHPRFEAVRILRTNLQFLDIDRDHKVITITSSLAGEGKSTTACNLAIALAQAGTRVALVEGDLRRPRVSEYLGIEKSVGLTTVLVGRTTLDAATQQAATPGLDVIASGALPPNPSEILQTDAMRSFVSELRHRYDVVLIDAPPLLPVTDASLLASLSDGAILVVRHAATGRDEVRTATERLQSVGARLLGSVLSMSPVKELKSHGYGYGYGYGPEYFERATGTPRGGRRRG